MKRLLEATLGVGLLAISVVAVGLQPAYSQGAASQWSPPRNNTGAETLGAPPDPVILQNGAGGAVRAGADRLPSFDLDGPYRVTQIMTYHYDSHVRPGTIALRNEDGTVYGPWQAAGAGSAALPNIYWWVRPDIVLPAGHYEVVDSNRSTWSQEASTHGAGITQIWGRRTAPETEPESDGVDRPIVE